MKDAEKIDDFSGKLSEILSKSAALGEEIEESKLVKKFLKSLPRKKYIHIIASLKQVLDLKTTSSEDIVGRLKAYEERATKEEEAQEDQGKLMYTNTDSQSSREYYNDYRGKRRRGGRSYKGRGRGGYAVQAFSEIKQGKPSRKQHRIELAKHLSLSMVICADL